MTDHEKKTDHEWKFGFGPRHAEFAWRCQRCSTIMSKTRRTCFTCSYTVFDPVHRYTQPQEDTT